MIPVIYTVLKEYFTEIHSNPVKARIMSPVNKEDIFVFQTSLFYKNHNSSDAHEPSASFTSFATAERHLLQYLEEFQSALDMGGSASAGSLI
ncbi:hypothetical protein ACFOWA_15680 [Pedobacter lithocola]|uniref:Uncharacterized protein n=1 Tax=Pedobacter lithocola TaxID=1908239 RepID=A0ABV8PEM4_9SPHI